MTWSVAGGHSLPAATRERIRARDGGRCRWRTSRGRCGSTDRCQVDHDVPVFEGGTDDDDNLRLLCHPHHARKTGSEAARAKAVRRAPRRRPPEVHPGRRTPVGEKKTSGGRPAAQGKKPGAKPGSAAASKGSAAGGRKSKR